MESWCKAGFSDQRGSAVAGAGPAEGRAAGVFTCCRAEVALGADG